MSAKNAPRSRVAALTLIVSLTAFTAPVLAASSTNWPTVGGDAGNTRYSPLTQVNPRTIGRLGGAWVRELGTKTRSAPVVLDGVMYIVDAVKIYALNAASGESLWEYTPGTSSPARGVAVAGGLVFCGLVDTHVIALDAKTGKLVWTGYIGNNPAQSYDKDHETFTALGKFDPRIGAITGAPTYVGGKVILGITGGDGGARGKITALEARTGKTVWQWWVTPEHGQPGSETWPADVTDSQLGGGAIWNHGAADPELGLVYFGTGNATPIASGEVPGNNLYTSSIVALDIRTGKLEWHSQLTHHDLWEMDVSTPPVMYDVEIKGKTRKALGVMRTDGYLFQFDRVNGRPLTPIVEKPVPQDATLHTAPTQPWPAETDQVGFNCAEADLVALGFTAACNFDPRLYNHPEVVGPGLNTRSAPMSFSQKTHFLYVMGGSGGRTGPGTPEYGSTTAIDTVSRKIIWQNRSPWNLIVGSGLMSTAGGVLFRMEGDGNFLALEAVTGRTLWKFQTGYLSGPTFITQTSGSPGAIYAMNGQEYIAIPVGKGLWAFKLDGRLPERPAPPRPPTEYGFEGVVQNLDADAQIVIGDEHPAQGSLGEAALMPLRAQVKAGQPVRFVNHGQKVHTIVSVDRSWTTGPLRPGQQAEVRIENPGRYTYFAEEFPWSKAQLIVQRP